MAVVAGTSIVDSGLILNIDPANEKAVQTGNLEVEYLIVAGGGSGGTGCGAAAGGGAGGVITGRTQTPLDNYAIVIGAGGVAPAVPNDKGNNGSNSTAFGLTAIGGGGGGSRNNPNGNSGGSGGGGSRINGSPGQALQPIAAAPGLGNVGGQGNQSGAGGGGAGGPGENAANIVDPFLFSYKGGKGITSGISGSINYYAAGGSSGTNGPTSFSVNGIGGMGDTSVSVPTNGVQNTGSGGGGGSCNENVGGNGGSGVVIVRYKGAQQASGGDSIYQSGPYTVHVFNNSGNFVVGGAVGDVSGNSNGGAVNGASYNAGNSGYYSFDGVDDYILGNSNLGLSGNPEFTIMYWARWNGATFSTNFPSGVGNNSVSITNQGLSTTWRSGKIALDFWSNRFRATSALNVQTWYHVTFTKTPGTISSTTKLYANAVQLSGAVEGSNTTPNIIDQPLIIGRLDSARWFNGNISDIRIYNRALTAEEVTQNFEATRGRFGV